uniref:Uncharacterized protein n=1 Tax=Timema douglasi TaxID=61478 RepID=A0A7R8VC44_TIMDO|nr:unnamed protein product [Timema douglasi]
MMVRSRFESRSGKLGVISPKLYALFLNANGLPSPNLELAMSGRLNAVLVLESSYHYTTKTYSSPMASSVLTDSSQLISDSQHLAVELNTTSALANYTTEAGHYILASRAYVVVFRVCAGSVGIVVLVTDRPAPYRPSRQAKLRRSATCSAFHCTPPAGRIQKTALRCDLWLERIRFPTPRLVVREMGSQKVCGSSLVVCYSA